MIIIHNINNARFFRENPCPCFKENLSRRTILKINRDVLPYNYNVNLLPVFMQIFKVIFLQTQTFAELEQKLRRRRDYYLMNDFHA